MLLYASLSDLKAKGLVNSSEVCVCCVMSDLKAQGLVNSCEW